MRAGINPVEISDIWILRLAQSQNGLFHSVSADILGPFKYKTARLTSNTRLEQDLATPGHQWDKIAKLFIITEANLILHQAAEAHLGHKIRIN